MKPWWYLAAMYVAYLLLMAAVRWLATKIGPRLPARWQPLLTTPTGRTPTGQRVLWIGLVVIAIFYAVLFLAGRHMGLD